MADKQAEFTATKSNGVISTGAMLYGPPEWTRGETPPRKMSGKWNRAILCVAVPIKPTIISYLLSSSPLAWRSTSLSYLKYYFIVRCVAYSAIIYNKNRLTSIATHWVIRIKFQAHWWFVRRFFLRCRWCLFGCTTPLHVNDFIPSVLFLPYDINPARRRAERKKAIINLSIKYDSLQWPSFAWTFRGICLCHAARRYLACSAAICGMLTNWPPKTPANLVPGYDFHYGLWGFEQQIADRFNAAASNEPSPHNSIKIKSIW